MSFLHVLLLSGQLVLGMDLSQGYNTAVFVGTPTPGAEPDGASVSIGAPRASARLLYPTSGYRLDYLGRYIFYDFDPTDSELLHQAEARGNWQIGASGTAEALEQLTYGSANTLRQVDLSYLGPTEVNAARTRFLMNAGRFAYGNEFEQTMQFNFAFSYSMRTSLDDPSAEVSTYSYDTLSPAVDIGVGRWLNEDNQLGLHVNYTHYLTPLASDPTRLGSPPEGGFFSNSGTFATGGALTFTHRFETWWTGMAEAGAVVGRSLAYEDERTFVGPTASASTLFVGPRLNARIGYQHGFGAYGTRSGSATFDAITMDVGFLPDPIRQRLRLFVNGDARRSVEALAELAIENEVVSGTAGVSYDLDEFIHVYSTYEYRYQAQLGGGPELDASFSRHIVLVGIGGELPMPRRLDTGDGEGSGDGEGVVGGSQGFGPSSGR